MLNFDWLADVPTAAAKWVFLILFMVIGLIVLTIPDEYIYEGVEQPRWWHNLKVWALGLLAFIFVTYYVF